MHQSITSAESRKIVLLRWAVGDAENTFQSCRRDPARTPAISPAAMLY
ncbi:hypothetical protein I552_6457 [Mycobacterium xenopi 3993]|nr:hypothetical protein I552_6457 [Mycobacterium xenopi 3993]